jgi:hypothetical protein
MTKFLLTYVLIVWAASLRFAGWLPCSAYAGGSTSSGLQEDGSCRPEDVTLFPQDSLFPQTEAGIEGTVVLTGGNRMPAPGVKRGPLHGIRSTIYIYGLTNISQVVRVGQSPYYSSIRTDLIRQADTDDTGYFKILLPAGHYSLFTKKGDLFYASRMDDRNNIAPVVVLPGKLTMVECRVESGHKAVY